MRDLTLNRRQDHLGRNILLLGIRDIDGRPLPLTWGDSTTEKPLLDTVEIWRLINTTNDTHPIHLHLVRFLILDRQPYDVNRLLTTGELAFTGPAIPAAKNELCLHCHMLEHEDYEMMRRMEVQGTLQF